MVPIIVKIGFSYLNRVPWSGVNRSYVDLNREATIFLDKGKRQ